ncbi:MAG: hypothetical protein RML46_03165 [Anaerolineae bacterium]|nr:hypothetical protein [Anaerolineae bacterium]MDW8067895.1 hypothetical protein [Anaerolineae bacterium]
MSCSTEYLVETAYFTGPFDTLRDRLVTVEVPAAPGSFKNLAWSVPLTGLYVSSSVQHPMAGKAGFQSALLIPERFWPTWDAPFLPDVRLLSQQYVQFVRIQETLEKIRRHGLKIIKTNEVQDYLQRYPELIDLVPEVARLVRSHLPDAQLTLSLYHDPEEEDEYLILCARFAKYDELALERIRRTRSAYRDMLTGCQGWIFLTTDFQAPESPYAV